MECVKRLLVADASQEFRCHLVESFQNEPDMEVVGETGDGLQLLELTQKLLHPSHQVEKEYLVWVTGDVSRGLPVLSGPMDLDGVPLSPAKVRRGRTSGGVTQLSITICQGKNRQVRRMCGQAGLKVLRLKRVREGGLCLDRTLGPGKWRRLEQSEVAALLQKP